MSRSCAVRLCGFELSCVQVAQRLMRMVGDELILIGVSELSRMRDAETWNERERESFCEVAGKLGYSVSQLVS